MTPKRKTEQEAPLTELYRLAEILQMRRVENYTPGTGNRSYYECQLCHGRSETATGEIEHRTGCPLERLRK